jgi:hypothetical protein
MARYDTRVEVLEAVRRRLRRVPTGPELAAAEKAGVWFPTAPAWDDQDVSDLVDFLQAHAPRTEASRKCVDWGAHSAAVLAGFRNEQREALALFGRKRFLELGQIAGFLITQAQKETARGDMLTMSLPSARGPAEEAVLFSRGYFDDELQRRFRACSTATDAADYDTRLRGVRSWAMGQANPIYLFSLLVEELADVTDLGEVDAIAFLLADAPVRLPRLTYRPSFRLSDRGTRMSVTITVHDLSVEAAEVERAYRQVRTEMLAGRVLPRRSNLATKRLRSASERTLQLLAFCRERKESEDFPHVLVAWNTSHASWKYGTYRSFYNAYRVAEERWGPKKGRTSGGEKARG